MRDNQESGGFTLFPPLRAEHGSDGLDRALPEAYPCGVSASGPASSPGSCHIWPCRLRAAGRPGSHSRGGRAIKEQKVRINEQIRISPIRLIDDEGEQVGIVSIEEARERAADKGLDLVEVAPDARPPVCRLMDYGKFKYEAARKAREAKKKQHNTQLKEVKFRPGIEDHDYDFKIRHARRFLEEGNKVKLTMMFRGRQMSHPEIGLEVLQRVTEDLQDLSKVEMQPLREGRTMTMVLAPLASRPE